MGKFNVKQLHWTRKEWTIVAWAAQQLLANGATRLDALTQAQQRLPPTRHANARHLRDMAKPTHKGLNAALAALAQLSTKQLEALLPPGTMKAENASPTPYLPRDNAKWEVKDTYKGRKHPVTWNELEWALVTRRADTWRAAGSNAGTGRLLQEAQEVELPADRRRPRAALMVNIPQYCEPAMQRARTEWAHLVAHIPYDPHARSYAPHKPVVQVPPPPPPAPAEPEETMAQAQAQAQREVETQAYPAPAPEKAPVQAPRPLPAALPPATQVSSAAHEAARSFGERLGEQLARTIVPLVEDMLTTHEQMVLTRVHEAQKAHATELADEMTRLLMFKLDELLGGSKPPAPPPAPVLQPLPVVDPPKRLKVDVVGFEQGHQQLLLKQRLNGTQDRVDLRFIGPNERTTYTPSTERHVVLLTGRVPHTLRDRIRSYGAPTTYVDRSVGDVAAAIKHLVEVAAKA